MPIERAYSTSYVITIVTSALSVAIYRLFAKTLKNLNIDQKNEGQPKEKKENYAIRLSLFEIVLLIFLENFRCSATYETERK